MTIAVTDARAAYDYIVAYKAAHDGNSPTSREIRDQLGGSSTSTVARILEHLVRRGLIRLPSSAVRSIEVVGAVWQPPDAL